MKKIQPIRLIYRWLALGTGSIVGSIQEKAGKNNAAVKNGFPLEKLNRTALCLLPSAFCLLGLVACSPNNPIGPVSLDSRYTDEQPAISGNGRFLAFVSNRDGSRNIMLYDLERQQFVDVPYLNRRDAIADSPSISNNARYIAYIASDEGRPEVQLYDRVTRRTQVLTRGYRGWVRNPSISPDGRYVAFESGRRGQWDIEVIDRGPTIELDRIDSRPSNVPQTSGR